VEKSPLAYRDIWHRKAVLRDIYGDIYSHIITAAVPGRILEIGGGSGNFKERVPHAISSDIAPAPWLDLVCDAQRLPFADASLANIVMVDVLHHIESPRNFLNEACRVLRPFGRLIMCEPAITPLSGIFYRLFHEELVDMSADPLAMTSISADKDPWESNQAIPTLLVGRYRDAAARAIPQLKLTRVDRFAFMAYPLSGGFKAWQLLPTAVAKPLLSLEWAVRGLLGRLAAFRLLAIYERRD
jgi:SAM-dependent methyltransferase